MVGDDSEARLTFGEVERAVRAIAAGLLGLGLNRGDRVMIRMGNEADYVLVYFGALAAGLVALPSSPQLTEGEAAFLMENSGAAAVVIGSGCTVGSDALGGRLLPGCSGGRRAEGSGRPCPTTPTPPPTTRRC